MKLWNDAPDKVHLLSLRQIFDVLSKPLLNFEAHLNVVVLIIGLVELVAFNAIEVLPHVKFLIFRYSALKPLIIEGAALFQHDSKDLFFTFV